MNYVGKTFDGGIIIKQYPDGGVDIQYGPVTVYHSKENLQARFNRIKEEAKELDLEV